MSIVKVYETTAFEVDWAALASEVEKRVMAKLQQDLANWSDDLSMREMFVGDAADSMKVCVLLEAGKWREAETKIWDMDTAARDYVYDFIAEVAGADFFDIVRAK